MKGFNFLGFMFVFLLTICALIWVMFWLLLVLDEKKKVIQKQWSIMIVLLRKGENFAGLMFLFV